MAHTGLLRSVRLPYRIMTIVFRASSENFLLDSTCFLTFAFLSTGALISFG
jgi:hypothetical protein